jgi:hypothetical protein
MRRAIGGSVAVAIPVAALALAAASGDDGPRPVSYSRDVQPIFDRSCTSCHPVAYPYLDLRSGHSYDDLVRVPAATNPAFARVLPGRPELSYLLTHPPDPSNAGLLRDDELALLRRWIAEGAPES